MRKILILLTFLLVQYTMAIAQQSVSCKIVDETGLPLPNVNISIKDSVNGTASDIDGKYTLTVNEGA